MSTIDEQMIQAMVPSLLSELAIELQIPRTEHFCYTEHAVQDLWDGLRKRITTVVTPAISQLFLEYLNDIDKLDLYLEDPEQAILEAERSDFQNRVTKAHCAFLQTRLPSLLLKVQETADLYQSFLIELHQRLETAQDEIGSVLLDGSPFHNLVRIAINSGDTHNKGRSTAVIETDTGSFVYKPHDVRIDRNTQELVSRLFSDVMKLPKVISCEGYGFCEYISNEPAVTEADAKTYFYNLGGMSAAVLMLGSDDLHHNNVLASENKPVIIDCELMVTPGKGYAKGGVAYELSHSLLFSSLMPSRRGHTDMSILFAVDEDNRSSPVVNGQRQCVLNQKEVFLDGFCTIYRRCMHHKKELKEWASTLQDVPVRHIYRATRTYTELLRQMLEPGWLEDPNASSALYQQLSKGLLRSGLDQVDAATNAEVRALLGGDIPYFYMKADTCDLWCDGDVVYPGFFPESCVTHLLSRIDSLSEAELAFEVDLLKKAFTRVIRRTYGTAAPDVAISQKKCPDELLRQKAEQIFWAITKDKVVTPGGNDCWFGPDYTVENGMELLNNGLMSGTAGLAVFFAAMHRMTDDPAVQKSALEQINSIRSHLEGYLNYLSDMEVIPANTENLSYSDGLSGKLLACHLIGSYLQDDSYHTLCRRITALMQKCDSDYIETDVYKGLAGALLVLCRYDDLFAMEGVKDLCSRFAEELLSRGNLDYHGQKLWKTLSNSPWPISGAGHGQSGVAAALYTAGMRLNRADLLEASRRGFAFEAEIYAPKIKAWPDRRRLEHSEVFLSGYCSGAAGIGMHALRLSYPGSERILELALESVLSQPLLYKDFLCCGNSAVSDFLLQAGREADARSRMAYVLERAEQSGTFNCMTQAVTEVFSPSLFYGVAGIGYELLRLLDPVQVESIYL